MGGILNLLVLIVVVGVVMWLINVYVPMMGAIKSILNLLVIILLILYILQFFGLIGPIMPTVRLFR